MKYLKKIIDSGIFTDIDINFANHIEELSSDKNSTLFFTAALISLNTRRGHICLELEKLSSKLFFIDHRSEEYIYYPSITNWTNALDTNVVGKVGDYTPLIIDNKKRLYLFRYWEYQKKVYEFIQNKTKGLSIVNAEIKDDINSLFKDSKEVVDWQKIAVFTALMKRFCVITGGPGTGKTTTVTKVMALLILAARKSGYKNFRIILAAPTGKAAARLSESVGSSKKKLAIESEILSQIPEEAYTVHRLLGSIDKSPYFVHNRNNKIPCDLIIVDEASMIDLALMSKLTDAIPEDGRLIIVGDKNQLSSVEAGAVLNDICGGVTSHTYTDDFIEKSEEILGVAPEVDLFAEQPSDMFESIAELKKSYRFGEKNGISQISRLVNEGMGDNGLKVMKNDRFKNVKWSKYPDLRDVPDFLKERILKGYKKYFSLDFTDPKLALSYFDLFRVLCVLRDGPYGVKAINGLIESTINSGKSDDFYPGRPVLITRNDYSSGLFNGDTGITIKDESKNLWVVFRGVDGKINKYHPSRLPEHETVFCMTIHKSQGSEFENILLITPDKDSKIYTREVVYTGITRAKKNVEIAGEERAFIEAVAKRISRSSGLRELIWNAC
ncbi:MAG: exodeoxyribonuclease V subunit alpha [Desulfobacterales bacterium]|nr:exodeoxyribonuclease V subunit alpha [Desulfobacterales bacterium]MCP4161732.1 exodeoxyribonuclease V subunit alpha [Deltaproteobacteria bacterium]